MQRNKYGTFVKNSEKECHEGAIEEGGNGGDDLNAKGVPARAPIGRRRTERGGVRRTGDDAAFDRSVQRGKVPEQSAVPSSLTHLSL